MQNRIIIYSNYLSDEEVLNWLSEYDLSIFPFQKFNESSSAEVWHCLASLRPILVTPLPVFDDVLDFVHYLQGITSCDIVVGIQSCYAKIEINSKNNQTNINSHKYYYKLRKIRF